MFYTEITNPDFQRLDRWIEYGFKPVTPAVLKRYDWQRSERCNGHLCRFCNKTVDLNRIRTHKCDLGYRGIETIDLLSACPNCGVVVRELHMDDGSGYWNIGQKRRRLMIERIADRYRGKRGLLGWLVLKWDVRELRLFRRFLQRTP